MSKIATINEVLSNSFDEVSEEELLSVYGGTDGGGGGLSSGWCNAIAMVSTVAAGAAFFGGPVAWFVGGAILGAGAAAEVMYCY